VFYINLTGSKTNGRNSRTHVAPCSVTVSPVCFEIFRFLGMSANPKLTFDSTLYQLAPQV